MSDLVRRVERLEQAATPEHGPALVLVVMPAGAEITPEQQKRIEDRLLHPEAEATGGGCVLVDLGRQTEPSNTGGPSCNRAVE